MNAIAYRYSLFLALVVALFGCDSVGQETSTGPEPLRPLSQAESRVIQSDNAFGLNLFAGLSSSASDKNIFISPLSVSMALGMTLNGADGETRAEMETALQKQGLSEEDINASYQFLIDALTNLDPKVKLNIANSIWYRDSYQVEQAFLDLNKSYFNSEVAALDFTDQASLGIINGWVDKQTNGLIDQILQQIKAEDIMYLINAIYFKGDWKYQFDASKTEDRSFFNIDASTSTVPMMTMHHEIPYAANDDVSLIDLPYGDSLFSMTIVLPNNPEDLDTIAANLETATWDQWTQQLQPVELDIFLPRFKLEYKESLVGVLKSLGIDKAFDSAKADFTRISQLDDLHISEVLHKSFVEVNEEGTEAAAVTSVTIGVTSIGPEPTAFLVDRPFLFFIKERQTGSILFVGQVTNL